MHILNLYSLKSRLVPLNHSEKLSNYWNILVSSHFPPAAVILKSCISILSLKTTLWSPSLQKEKVCRELTQNLILWIGIKLLNSVHESCFGLAWLGVLLWLFASSSLSEPTARTPSPPYPAGVPVTPATQPHFWPILNLVKHCTTCPQSGAGPYHGLLLKGQSPFSLSNSLINQNGEENIYIYHWHAYIF